MGIVIDNVTPLLQEIVTFCKKINRLTTTQEWSFYQIRNACLDHTLTVDRLLDISMEEFESIMADMRKRLRQSQGIIDDDHDHDFTMIETPEDEQNKRLFKQDTKKKCVELVPLYYHLFLYYQISSFVQFNRFARYASKIVG
jgi:hypothetical protein